MEVGYSRIKAGFSILRIDGSVCHRSGNPSITNSPHQARPAAGTVIYSEAICIDVYRCCLSRITMPSSVCLPVPVLLYIPDTTWQTDESGRNPRGLLHELPEAKQQTQPQISAVMPLCGLREGTGRLFASRQATSDDDLGIKARQQAIFWFTVGGQGVICHPRSILSASLTLCIICFLAKHVSSYYQRQKDSRAGTNSSENCS
jgi:hypothetical protein